MKKSTKYRQCGLLRELPNDSTSFQTSFIPARFAKPQQVVRLRQADGQWEDGWKVVSIGAGVDDDHLPDPHKRIGLHRKSTGDSQKRAKRKSGN